MNFEKLKRSVGYRVQLDPTAIHLDRMGRELPTQNEDWVVVEATESYVRLDGAEILPLTTKIGTDSVHHFSRNAARSIVGGIQYGFYTLALQMFIQQDVISWRPCRPGERAAPPQVPQVVQQWVDFNYPQQSGIQTKLEAAGYRIAWISESRLAGLTLEGWEVAVERDPHGMPCSFHLRTRPENMLLVKKLT